MKKVILVGGAMGVGKSTVCEIIKQACPRCVLLDADNLWNMHPFTVTEETKGMVMDNIRHCLLNFLHCTAIDTIVFCWVMHQQEIIDEIISFFPKEITEVYRFSLVCSPEALRRRLKKDIDCGIRQPDVTERSLRYLPLYAELDTVAIDVSDIDAKEAAYEIVRRCFPEEE